MTEATITKRQFIAQYEDVEDKYKTKAGFVLRDEHGKFISKEVALRCRCDYEDCQGWAMITDDRGRKDTRYSAYYMHIRQNRDDNMTDYSRPYQRSSYHQGNGSQKWWDSDAVYFPYRADVPINTVPLISRVYNTCIIRRLSDNKHERWAFRKRSHRDQFVSAWREHGARNARK